MSKPGINMGPQRGNRKAHQICIRNLSHLGSVGCNRKTHQTCMGNLSHLGPGGWMVEGRTATLPRGMSFLIVSSYCQWLDGVDQMNARLWDYHVVHLILVRHWIAGTLIKTYDGYRISKTPSQNFLTLGKGLSKATMDTRALHLKRSWN